MTTPLSGKPTFGAGRAFMIPNVANPTPIRALVPQSQSIDTKRKLESLYGENIFAEAVGAGETEITCKVEFGKSVASVMAQLISGDGSTTGSYLEADKEAGTVAAVSPYTYSAVNAAEWLFDLGVKNVATGAIYTCVASGSEVAGKSYSVAAGVYKFASGDEGVNVLVSYAYSNTTAGVTVTLANQMQGPTGSFQGVHVFPWGAEQDMVVFNNCLASSSSLSAKKSGFGSTSLDYTVAVNSNGTVGTATFAEAA
jgi:hypothetical protein